MEPFAVVGSRRESVEPHRDAVFNGSTVPWTGILSGIAQTRRGKSIFMGKEIVINAKKDQTVIAIVEDGSLAEMYMEGPENERTIGDIFLGRIRRIMPSIQAAFVDIGQKSDAFLHFSDLSENYPLLRQLITSEVPEVGASSFVTDHQGRVRRHHPRSPDPSDDYELDDEDEDSETVRSGRAGTNREERHRRHSAQQRRGGRGGRGGRDAGDDRRTSDDRRGNSGPPLSCQGTHFVER
jgi:ribonuclease G